MKPEEVLKLHYEKCLAEHAGTPQEVDWESSHSARVRYETMCDLIDFCVTRTDSDKVIDFGCGTGSLLTALLKRFPKIRYRGVDISEKMILVAKQRVADHVEDLRFSTIKDPEALPETDFMICCGTFTEKREVEYSDMFSYLKETLGILWSKVHKGIAFNLMDPAKVEWEREDLFFVSYDKLSKEILNPLGIRNYILRGDYGLREYTVYCYR